MIVFNELSHSLIVLLFILKCSKYFYWGYSNAHKMTYVQARRVSLWFPIKK